MFSASFKSIRAALLLLILVQPVSVCADGMPYSVPADSTGSNVKGAAVSSAVKPTKDTMMTIKTPTNVLELMENLRDVLRSRLVFDEAFYTEENVRKITAARDVEVIRDQEKPELLKAEAFDFRAIADNLESHGGGLSVSITLETRSDGKRSAIIRSNIRRDQPLLHYLVIEKMIGCTWKRSKHRPLGRYQIYQNPTDPYGNAKREYIHQDGGIEEKGFFRFDPAGLLESLFLRSEVQ